MHGCSCMEWWWVSLKSGADEVDQNLILREFDQQLVLGGLFDVVDDEVIDGDFGGGEVQAEGLDVPMED